MFTRILNFDVATHTDKRGTAFFLLCLQKNEMIDQKKKVLDDVETMSIYIRKKESSAVMILNHFVSFHITHLLIYIKSDAAAAGGFFLFPLVQAGILQSSNYLPYLPDLSSSSSSIVPKDLSQSFRKRPGM